MIYEDYFKNVIGGNFKSPEYYNTTYENKTYEPIQVNGEIDNDININEVMELYPDIYKVVLPMIDKMLIGKNTDNLSDSVLNVWTLEIYDALEAEDNVNFNQVYESETTNAKPANFANKVGNTSSNVTSNTTLNVSNNTSGSKTDNRVKNINRTNNISTSANMNKTTNLKDKTIDVVARYQNRNNPILRDLIKIMILNRLFGNNNNYNRPPRPPYPNFNNPAPNVPRPNNPMPNNPAPNAPRPNNPMPNNPRPNYQGPNNSGYRPVDVSPYNKYLKNTPKTYFDVPYPEEEG